MKKLQAVGAACSLQALLGGSQSSQHLWVLDLVRGAGGDERSITYGDSRDELPCVGVHVCCLVQQLPDHNWHGCFQWERVDHCWKLCRLKDILKFNFNDFLFHLWDKVIWSTSGQVTGHSFGPANLFSSTLVMQQRHWVSISFMVWLADMLPCCPHPQSSAVMCSSLVILLWLKTPSAHKMLPLPV